MRVLLIVASAAFSFFFTHSAVAQIYSPGLNSNNPLIATAKGTIVPLPCPPDAECTNPWAHYSSNKIMNAENVYSLEIQNVLPSWESRQGSDLLVSGDMVFIATEKSGAVLAYDLSEAARLVWKFEPKRDPDFVVSSCCKESLSSLAIYDDFLFWHLEDGRVTAINTRDGSLQWSAKTHESLLRKTMNTNLFVADGVLVVSRQPEGLSSGGAVSAYDVQSGELQWRASSLGSVSDTFISSEIITGLNSSREMRSKLDLVGYSVGNGRDFALIFQRNDINETKGETDAVLLVTRDIRTGIATSVHQILPSREMTSSFSDGYGDFETELRRYEFLRLVSLVSMIHAKPDPYTKAHQIQSYEETTYGLAVINGDARPESSFVSFLRMVVPESSTSNKTVSPQVKLPETAFKSGVLITSGSLAIYGDQQGALEVLDIRTGDIVHRQELPAKEVHRIVSFIRNDKQFLAIIYTPRSAQELPAINYASNERRVAILGLGDW